jgi:hypothetical protein
MLLGRPSAPPTTQDTSFAEIVPTEGSRRPLWTPPGKRCGEGKGASLVQKEGGSGPTESGAVGSIVLSRKDRGQKPYHPNNISSVRAKPSQPLKSHSNSPLQIRGRYYFALRTPNRELQTVNYLKKDSLPLRWYSL